MNDFKDDEYDDFSIDDILSGDFNESDFKQQVNDFDDTPAASQSSENNNTDNDETADSDKKLTRKQKSEEKRKKFKKEHPVWFVLSEIGSYILVIIFAVCLALFINIYCARITIVDGSSMYPTLTDTQKVCISKIPYIFGSEKRGDIIVLDSENNARTLGLELKEALKSNIITSQFFKNTESNDRLFIKRIIAIEGDTLSVKDGQLYLNGELLVEDYFTPYEEPNYSVWEGKSWTVGEGEVFVMGDNRNHSLDSRYDTDQGGPGMIQTNAIVGKML